MLAGIFFLLDYRKSLPTAFAIYNPEKTDYYLEHPDELKSMYNSNIDKIPSTLRWVFGDERLNITLARMDGSEVNLAVETENGLIKDIQKGEIADPTMQVEISEETIKRISESDNPVDELEEALDTGEINYENERIISSVKTGIFEAVVNVMSWFS